MRCLFHYGRTDIQLVENGRECFLAASVSLSKANVRLRVEVAGESAHRPHILSNQSTEGGIGLNGRGGHSSPCTFFRGANNYFCASTPEHGHEPFSDALGALGALSGEGSSHYSCILLGKTRRLVDK